MSKYLRAAGKLLQTDFTCVTKFYSYRIYTYIHYIHIYRKETLVKFKNMRDFEEVLYS